jgi:hypothetical protein
LLQIEENVDSDRLRSKLQRAKKRRDTKGAGAGAYPQHPLKKARTLPGTRPIGDARKSEKRFAAVNEPGNNFGYS